MKFIITFFVSLAVLLGSVIGIGASVLEEKIGNAPEKLVRMAQIRLLPKDVRSAVVRDYARRLPNRSNALILGDSQTYGFYLTPTQSLGAYMRNEQHPNIYNMSIIDGRDSDQLNVINILKQEKRHFEYVIININPAYFKKDVKNPFYLPDAYGYSLMYSLATTSTPGIYVPFVNIFGMTTPLVRNRTTSIYSVDIYSLEYKGWVGFNEVHRKDYYSDLEASARDITKVLEAASGISDKVIAFASPTSYEIYNKKNYNYNWDTRPLNGKILENCRSVERAICVDLSDAIPHEYFLDVIHLKSEGQRMLAGYLSDIMNRYNSGR